MRFVWPAQRYDRLTREAVVVAAAVTAGTSVAIVLPIVTIYRAAERGAAPHGVERPESISFIKRIAPSAVARSTSRLAQPQPASPRARVVEQVIKSDTGSRPASPPAAVSADERPAKNINEATTSARALGPFGAPAAVTNSTGMTEAERERRLRELAPPLPFLAKLPPTTEQIDSAGREQARRAAVARDEHRPMAIPLGSVTLSWGPSPAQRRRDSILYADNLQRLARLAARARGKRDSLLGANTLAHRDSARPFRRDSQPND